MSTVYRTLNHTEAGSIDEFIRYLQRSIEAKKISGMPDDIVNVALVPHRSPFRYPGGKTWLVPRIRRWLAAQSTRPNELVEPFAGGGIASLTAVFEGLVDKVTMVELDHDVASVWKTILDGEGEWLAEAILSFEMTAQAVDEALSQQTESVRENAFRTILKNRVNRGGILAPGAGLVKHGENGKGLKSRWYPQTLSKRIRDIIAIRERISFIEGDGLEVLRARSQDANVVFFIDPPTQPQARKRAADCIHTRT